MLIILLDLNFFLAYEERVDDGSFWTNQFMFLDILQRHFDLTPKEGKLALVQDQSNLVAGKGIDDISNPSSTSWTMVNLSSALPANYVTSGTAGDGKL